MTYYCFGNSGSLGVKPHAHRQRCGDGREREHEPERREGGASHEVDDLEDRRRAGDEAVAGSGLGAINAVDELEPGVKVPSAATVARATVGHAVPCCRWICTAAPGSSGRT